jgi:hypothetical protein
LACFKFNGKKQVRIDNSNFLALVVHDFGNGPPSNTIDPCSREVNDFVEVAFGELLG